MKPKDDSSGSNVKMNDVFYPSSTRRQTLLAISAGMASFLLSRMAQARLISGVYSKYSRNQIDRLVSPTSSVFLDEWESGYYRFRINSIPSHGTGLFPNANCPYPLSAQFRTFKMAKEPRQRAVNSPLSDWVFGIAVNGIIFDPSGPYYKQTLSSGLQYNVLNPRIAPYFGLDSNSAHTQTDGSYHYHSIPVGLVDQLKIEMDQRGESLPMILLGWAADGFPIYHNIGPRNAMDPKSSLVTLNSSYRLGSGYRRTGPGGIKDGTYDQDYIYMKGAGHLDACNGRFGCTPEFPKGTYYYVISAEYPFIPRYWKGTADSSFYHPSAESAVVPQAVVSLFGG